MPAPVSVTVMERKRESGAEKADEEERGEAAAAAKRDGDCFEAVERNDDNGELVLAGCSAFNDEEDGNQGVAREEERAGLGRSTTLVLMVSLPFDGVNLPALLKRLWKTWLRRIGSTKQMS